MTMMSEFLSPTPGGWVRRRDRSEYGRVQKVVPGNSGVDLVVEWQPERRIRRVPLAEVQCGLQLGMTVQDVPHSGNYKERLTRDVEGSSVAGCESLLSSGGVARLVPLGSE